MMGHMMYLLLMCMERGMMVRRVSRHWRKWGMWWVYRCIGRNWWSQMIGKTWSISFFSFMPNHRRGTYNSGRFSTVRPSSFFCFYNICWQRGSIAHSVTIPEESIIP